MSVDLFPAELAFKRPFTHEVSQILRLHNSNKEPVAFKVKTTAPKQYCVRPNSGRIDPGSDVEVQVLLQAMKEDPPAEAKCRDKFLVQSVAIAGHPEDSNITQIWAGIEQTAKSSIQERKIRVSWLGTDGGAASGASANGLAAHDDEPPAYSSPGPLPVTPQRRSDLEQSRSPTTSDITSSLQAAAASVSNATGITQDDLKRQLDEAKATISRLQQQAADATGLRQRNTGTDIKTREDASGKTKSTLQANPPAGGVPVQIVAVLCLICFLIAYLFF